MNGSFKGEICLSETFVALKITCLTPLKPQKRNRESVFLDLRGHNVRKSSLEAAVVVERQNNDLRDTKPSCDLPHCDPAASSKVHSSRGIILETVDLPNRGQCHIM